jgi:hypothetical protein
MKSYREVKEEMKWSYQAQYIRQLEKKLEEKRNRRENIIIVSSLVILLSVAAACNPDFRKESPGLVGFLRTGIPFACAAFALWLAKAAKEDISFLESQLWTQRKLFLERELRSLPPPEIVAKELLQEFGQNFDPGNRRCIEPIVEALEGEAIREGRSLTPNDAEYAARALVRRLMSSTTPKGT